MEENIGYIHSTETLGLLDGPGVRTVFFLQGCPLSCAYCHNPDSQDMTRKNPYTSQDVLKLARKYKTYYGQDGGVTFSGGEPLVQGKFLQETVKLLKKENINIVIDTSGFGDKRYYSEILPYVDTILLDVKAFDKESFQDLAKGDFAKFLEFMELLKKTDFFGQIWIRHVMVPGLTDNEESMKKLVRTIRPIIKYVEKLEILPYHTMGVKKYEELGRKYPLEGILSMDKKRAKDLERYANRLLVKEIHYFRNKEKERVKNMDGKKYITKEQKEKYKEVIFNSVDLLKNIPDETAQEIYEDLLVYNVEKGDLIFKSNDMAVNMYVILEGKAKIYYNTSDGREQIYYLYDTGDFIGGHNLLNEENYLYNAQAITDMVVLAISKDIFEIYMANSPKVLRKLLSKSFERIRWAEELIMRLSTSNTSMRVAALLLKLAEDKQENEDGNIELNLDLTREELGNYSGLTRETVTRKLSEFKDLGYIDMGGNKTLILKDIDTLKNYIM